MDELAIPEIPPLLALGLWLLIVAGIATFCRLGARLVRGEFLPYARRRPVPWKWIDIALVIVVQASLATLLAWADGVLYGPPVKRSVPLDQAAQTAHPLVVLLRDRPTFVTLLLAGLVAVVVAAVVEEFLFRLLLQGWLEAAERRGRRRWPALRALGRGTLPLLGVSLLFGAMHYRPGPPDYAPDELTRLFVRMALLNVFTLGFALLWIRWRTGASAGDFGFLPARFLSDVGLGLLSFLALIVPIYAVQITLKMLLPDNPIVDPITLFLFALALGLLYQRTHRIVPSITLHMALNATSLLAAWAVFSQ